jgi:isopentenyldiphosphate isomerase
MEHFDILDEHGNPTGREKSRDLVHRDGDWHRTVHVWIVNSKREVLLQRRSLTKESHPGKWDISAAGHIEAGTMAIEAAVREVGEELGVSVTATDLRYLFTVHGEYRDQSTGFLDREYSDVYLLERDLDVGSLTVQKDEVAEVRFVAADELARRVREHDASLVSHDEEYQRLFGVIGHDHW